MKKMISMISVAMLAVVFAAACGDAAKNTGTTGTTGTTTATTAVPDAADKKLCKDVSSPANQADCDVVVTLAKKTTHGCLFVAGTPGKCVFEEGAKIPGHDLSLAADKNLCEAKGTDPACKETSDTLVNKAKKECKVDSGKCVFADR